MYDVIIIGAGASGLMGGSSCLHQREHVVALLEHKDDIGKKNTCNRKTADVISQTLICL